MRSILMPATLAVALLLLTFAPPALASDGVLEINQTCAVQTGCFAGDAAGFPVTIDGTAGHSFRLTSDLTVLNENTTGIVLSAPDLSVDLGGFAINGNNTCTLPPVGCRLTGSGTGIYGQADRLLVSNGSIVGLGNAGIFFASGNGQRVLDVRLAQNRNEGIRIDGSWSTVERTTVMQNGGTGVALREGSSVSGNTVFYNGGAGITTRWGSTISGNTVHENGGAGISADFGSTVSGNTVYQNGGSGIVAGSGSTVQGNAVSANTGFGLDLFLGGTYRANAITSNQAGTVKGGVNMGDNACGVLPTCP